MACSKIPGPLESQSDSTRSKVSQLPPMLNPVILSHFFNACSLSQIKVFRLVCKQWLDSSLERWRQETEIKLISKIPHDEFQILTRKGTSWKRMKDLHNMYKMGEKPFTNFYLYDWKISLKDKEMLLFWDTYGHWMRKLCIDDCKFPEALMTLFLTKTPNLQVLTIGSFHQTIYDDKNQLFPINPQPQNNLKVVKFINHSFPGNWTNVLQLFPNFKEICLENIGKNYDEAELVLEAIKALQETTKKRISLTSLDLLKCSPAVSVLPLPILKLFRDLKLPLKSLKLDFGTNTEDWIIQEVLKIHEESLQILHCHSSQFMEGFPFQANFQNLRDLQLHGRTVTSFSFLKETPNLGKLHLFETLSPTCRFKEDFTEKDSEELISLPKMDLVTSAELSVDMSQVQLKYLQELHGDFELDKTTSFQTLTRWMPHVTWIRLRVPKQLFPILCTAWKDTLVKVDILPGSELDDETLTGVPFAKLKTRKKPPQRRPNITDLKRLEEFHICEYHWKRFTLEDVLLTKYAVQDGFLQMPTLKVLIICVAEDIDQSLMEKLHNRLQKVHVYRCRFGNMLIINRIIMDPPKTILTDDD